MGIYIASTILDKDLRTKLGSKISSPFLPEDCRSKFTPDYQTQIV
jgi:hypothetical protein